VSTGMDPNDVTRFIELADNTMQTARGALQGLIHLIDTMDEAETSYRGAQEDFRGIIERLVAAVRKLGPNARTRRRWQTGVAISALIAGVLGLLWSTRLSHGFGASLLEALAVAFLTYVAIDVLLHWMVTVPSREREDIERQIDEAVEVTEQSLATLRELEAVFSTGREWIDELKATPGLFEEAGSESTITR
jgi:hypothetical protein